MIHRGEIAFPLGLLAFVVAILIVGGLGLRHAALVIGFPLGVGIVTGALCVAVVVKTNRRPAAPERYPSIAWSEAAGIVAVLPLMLLLGYPVGLAVYLAAYLRWRGEGWSLTLGCALGSLAVSYGVFVKILEVPLPLGPWTLP